LSNKILTLLGFASKARKLSFGFSSAKESVLEKKAKLIVVADDVSDKSKKEVKFLSEKYDVKYIVLTELNMTAVSNAVGKSCGVISVNDSSFADGILIAMGGNANDK